MATLQGVAEIFEILPVDATLSCIEKLLQIGGLKANGDGSFSFMGKMLFVGRELSACAIEGSLIRESNP